MFMDPNDNLLTSLEVQLLVFQNARISIGDFRVTFGGTWGYLKVLLELKLWFSLGTSS